MFELKADLQPDEREFGGLIENDVEELAEKAFRAIVRLVPVEMRDLLNNSPATGRRYQVKGIESGRRFEVASSKGNPPRNQSFDLNKSIESRVTGKFSGEVEMLWYGEYHDENGRPFIEKAFTSAIEKSV